MKNFFYVLTAFLLFSSCNEEEATIDNVDAFLGTWQLKSIIYQRDIALSVPSDVIISFNDTSNNLSFSGNSSCNNYGGKVTKITTQHISFSKIFATEMACIGEKGTFESIYFELLPQIDQYRLENDMLVLLFSNTYLNFEKVN